MALVCRAAERITGPWGSFNFGPLVYLSLYILCHVMLHESLSFVTKGGLGVLLQKKLKKILENAAILCILVTEWIVIAYSTGIYIGIDKCSGPSISLGPREIPPLPPPLSGPGCMSSYEDTIQQLS